MSVKGQIHTSLKALFSAALLGLCSSAFALDTPDLSNSLSADAIFSAISDAGFSAGLAEVKDAGLEIATAQLADFEDIATVCASTIQTEENSQAKSIDNRACEAGAATSKIERVCYADEPGVLWFHIREDAHRNIAGKNIALVAAQENLAGNIAISFGAGEVICLTDATHPTTQMVSRASNNPLIGELMGTGQSCLYIDFSDNNDTTALALRDALGMPSSFIAKYTNPDDNSINGENACN